MDDKNEMSLKCSDCNKLKTKCKCKSKWTYVCENDECFLVRKPSPEKLKTAVINQQAATVTNPVSSAYSSKRK